MGRVEQFENGKRKCFRRELDGCPVVVTVKRTVTRYRRKEVPTTVTRWTGRHLLELGQEMIEADGSIIEDAGPLLGVSLMFERHRETSYTEAERAAGRAKIERVVREVFGCGCIWDGEGETKEKPSLTV